MHDCTQWLFPLPDPSAFNPDAPIPTRETIETFGADPELRQALRSLTRMLDFYGLALESMERAAYRAGARLRGEEQPLAEPGQPQSPAPDADPDPPADPARDRSRAPSPA